VHMTTERLRPLVRGVLGGEPQRTCQNARMFLVPDVGVRGE
jgi:hypothetical protein